MTEKREIIRKKKFIVVVPKTDNEIFVVHIAALIEVTAMLI